MATESATKRRSFQLITSNSTCIALVLSILLSITLFIQVVMLFYHDDFIVQMNIMENKLMSEIAAVEDIASDAFNAAHFNEDHENSREESAPHKLGQRLAFDTDNMHDAKWDESTADQYSMEPEDILGRAGVDPSEGYMPQMSFKESRRHQRQGIKVEKKMAVLPTLEEIQSMYGSKAYIHGLERCDDYRKAVPDINRLMGPAGLFNSATNLLATLLKMNCVNKKRLKSKRFGREFPTGVLPQAPWGKHNPAPWRNIHSAKFAKWILHQTDFLPIVIIKDPITWMASMCRHGYEARWWRQPQHCPNLVPNKYDKRGGYKHIGEGEIRMSVKFATPYIGRQPMPDPKNKTFVNYTSMIGLWNTWYGQWYDVDFPRVMVRFEDLLFHAEETITKLCECGGGQMQKKFHYMEDSAKGSTGVHQGSAGFLASLVNYGNSTLRMKDILKWEKDVEYFNEHVDKELMELFGYAYL